MPAPIDTQAPLMRRKALIQKLMAQMGPEASAQGGINVPQINLGRVAGVKAPTATQGSPQVRPGNLEPRSALVAGLRSQFDQTQGIDDPKEQQANPPDPELPPAAANPVFEAPAPQAPAAPIPPEDQQRVDSVMRQLYPHLFPAVQPRRSGSYQTGGYYS